MSSSDWSDDFTQTCYYDPPRSADEPCEETPVEGGKHVVVSIGRSGRCIFCKREVEQ